MKGLFKLTLFHIKLLLGNVNSAKATAFILLTVLSATSAFGINLPFINNGIPFEVSLKSIQDKTQYKALIDSIQDGIDTQRTQNITLRQYTDPDKIARFEKDIIRKILKSQGYYRFLIDSKLIPKKTQHTDPKAKHTHNIDKIVYQLTPGKQYKVNEITFNLDSNIRLNDLPSLDIQVGDALIAKNVLTSVDTLRRYIRQEYCFYSIKIDYQATINHLDNSAVLVFDMEPSEQTKFSSIDITGLETIDYAHIRSFINYDNGHCFKRDKIDASRLAILRSNLISNVTIDISDINNNGVKTTYKVNERQHRTIKAGIGYSTDEGPYLTSGWEHRNIGGAGEKLDISTRISSIRQKLMGEYFIPTFFNKNKSLTLYSEAKNEELDAYKALSLKAGAKLGFKRTEHLKYSLGTELKVSDVNDEGNKESFYLASLPLELEWDHTNDILDPTHGFLISAEIRPYIDIINTETKFYKTMFSMSGYHTFDIPLQPTLAARYSLGAITGESVENIPADERFYVGGGGSVRGYPYQSLSNLDDDDPEGGASFQQINTELRIRFLENWGLATFVGGGFAFEDATPNFDQKLLWGAGLGLRYYTAFAPFRMDLAFPLDKREDYDDDFQLYISIGQAF